MTQGGLPAVNPFRPQESGAEHFVDVGGAHAQLAEFTAWLPEHSDSGFVLVSGGSGTGKSTLIRRCVAHWQAGLPPHATLQLVDLSERPRGMPMAVSKRRAAVCSVTVSTLRARGALPSGVLDAVEGRVAHPDEFYRFLSAALIARNIVLVLHLPPVGELLSEAKDYVQSVQPGIVFFAESDYLTDPQLDSLSLAGALVLRLHELGDGELSAFIADRTRRAVGVFPGMRDNTIDRLSRKIHTIGQAQNRLYRVYENRLRRGDQYGSENWVEYEDVMSSDGNRLIEPDPTPVVEPQSNVAWFHDLPARNDILRRKALAEVLALRLRENHRDHPDSSLLMHIDGAWGTGKTTLLSLLEKQLVQGRLPDDLPYEQPDTPERTRFTVVRFDAWQQSRLALPWWSLLSSLRSAVLRQRKVTRPLLYVREAVARARRAGGRYLLPLLVLPVLAALVWLGMSRLLPGENSADVMKAVSGGLSALVLLWSGAKVVNRTLLWRSARGARLFEQTDSNPTGRIVQQFSWYLDRSRLPVIFLIDDLDRCKQEYVVDLLDTVQTMIRGYPEHSGTGAPRAASFVVAADGAWIRTAYTTEHNVPETQTETLGHRFSDKLFQFSVPMPRLSGGDRDTLLRHLLPDGETQTPTDEIDEARAQLQDARGDEKGILALLNRITTREVLDAVAPAAAVAVSASGTTTPTEPKLVRFGPLLSGNPREIKLFLNTYGMLRAIRTLEGNTVEPDVLALWSVLRVRWPAVADHLQHEPESVRAIREPRWWSTDFPEHLRSAIRDSALRAVVTHPEGGPLTAHAIRQCCGTL
jgi:hypothetical protein